MARWREDRCLAVAVSEAWVVRSLGRWVVRNPITQRPNDQSGMKYLITFEKGESARWLGHLDILRTFERAIRRAELPIAFSTGFNPREKIAFASALGVG